MPKNRELTPPERADVYNRRKAGQSLISIAKVYSITAEGVRKIVKRLDQRENAENLPRCGRPRLTTAATDRRILAEVRKSQNSC